MYIQSRFYYKRRRNIKRGLFKCKFYNRALNRIKIKNHIYNINNQNQNQQSHCNSNDKNIHMVISYTKGLHFKSIYNKLEIQAHFKGGNTIKILLVAPKDRYTITQKGGVINRLKCDKIECDEDYISESKRSLGKRFKVHLRAPLSIFDHVNTTGHPTSVDNFNIVDTVSHNFTRTNKEAMFIIFNDPSSIGTLENTNCQMYGMRSYPTLKTSNASSIHPLTSTLLCDLSMGVPLFLTSCVNLAWYKSSFILQLIVWKGPQCG